VSALRTKRLAQRIQEHRAGKGIREAAGEVGVSPATLSRVENGKVPGLETFSKICRWLGEDPAIYLGITPAKASGHDPNTEASRLRKLMLDAAQKAITEKRIERLERAFIMLFDALDDPYWPGRISIEGPMRELVRDIRKELGWPND
jgi:transcriptional regulator with XRE-family HTH domain